MFALFLCLYMFVDMPDEKVLGTWSLVPLYIKECTLIKIAGKWTVKAFDQATSGR